MSSVVVLYREVIFREQRRTAAMLGIQASNAALR